MDPSELRLKRIRDANQKYEDVQRNIKEVDKLSEDTEQGRTIVIKSMHGLGDNINERAFIKELGKEIYLDTPWPEIYEDLPQVKFLKCSTHLRTQVKNIRKQSEDIYSEEPTKNITIMRVFYTTRDLQIGSQLRRFWQQFGVKPKVYDLPFFPMPRVLNNLDPNKSKIAVVRPATLRKEWTAASRNPDPAYIATASKILMDKGYIVVSICDTETDQEWTIGEEPPAHHKFHRGELSVRELLGLVENASVLVGGHGWLTHAALACKKPMLWIGGGYGGDNSPKQIADPDFIDNSCITFILPDNYCKCSLMIHDCDKRISNFDNRVLSWIGGLS